MKKTKELTLDLAPKLAPIAPNETPKSSIFLLRFGKN